MTKTAPSGQPGTDNQTLSPEKARRLLRAVFLETGDIGAYLHAIATDAAQFSTDPEDEASGFLFTPDAALAASTIDELVERIGLGIISDRLYPGVQETLPPHINRPDGRKNPVFMLNVGDKATPSTHLDVDCETLTMSIALHYNAATGLHQVDHAFFNLTPPGSDPYDSANLTEIPLGRGSETIMTRYFELFSRTALGILARQPDIEEQAVLQATALARSLRDEKPGHAAPGPHP